MQNPEQPIPNSIEPSQALLEVVQASVSWVKLAETLLGLTTEISKGLGVMNSHYITVFAKPLETSPTQVNLASFALTFCVSLLMHIAVLATISSPIQQSKGSAFFRISDTNSSRLTVTFVSNLPTRPSNQNEERDVSEVINAAMNERNRVIDDGVVKQPELPAISPEPLTVIESPSPLSTGILPAPELRYYTADELDQHPVISKDIPSNPTELLRHPQGGTMVLRLWINKLGRVVRVEPVASELPQAFFDSARANFLKSTFSPGRKLGSAVDSLIDVVISYSPIRRLEGV